jgi:hypothetical protein
VQVGRGGERQLTSRSLVRGSFGEFTGTPHAEGGRVVYGDVLAGGADQAAGIPRNPGGLRIDVPSRRTLDFGVDRPEPDPNAGASRGIWRRLSDSRDRPGLAVNGAVRLAIGMPSFGDRILTARRRTGMKQNAVRSMSIALAFVAGSVSSQ